MTEIRIEKLEHAGRLFACLYFPYDPELIGPVKRINRIRWSNKKRCWWLPLETGTLKEITTKLGNKARLILPDGSTYVPGTIQPQRRKNQSTNNPSSVSEFSFYLQGKRMSKSTIMSYSGLVGDFFPLPPLQARR